MLTLVESEEAEALAAAELAAALWMIKVFDGAKKGLIWAAFIAAAISSLSGRVSSEVAGLTKDVSTFGGVIDGVNAETARVAEEHRLAAEPEAARVAEEARLAAAAKAARAAKEQRLVAEAEAARIAKENRWTAVADAARVTEGQRPAEAALVAEANRVAADADAARRAPPPQQRTTPVPEVQARRTNIRDKPDRVAMPPVVRPGSHVDFEMRKPQTFSSSQYSINFDALSICVKKH